MKQAAPNINNKRLAPPAKSDAYTHRHTLTLLHIHLHIERTVHKILYRISRKITTNDRQKLNVPSGHKPKKKRKEKRERRASKSKASKEREREWKWQWQG